MSLFDKIDLNCYIFLPLSNDKLLLIIFYFLCVFPSFISNTSILIINFRANLNAQNAGNVGEYAPRPCGLQPFLSTSNILSHRKVPFYTPPPPPPPPAFNVGSQLVSTLLCNQVNNTEWGGGREIYCNNLHISRWWSKTAPTTLKNMMLVKTEVSISLFVFVSYITIISHLYTRMVNKLKNTFNYFSCSVIYLAFTFVWIEYSFERQNFNLQSNFDQLC